MCFAALSLHRLLLLEPCVLLSLPQKKSTQLKQSVINDYNHHCIDGRCVSERFLYTFVLLPGYLLLQDMEQMDIFCDKAQRVDCIPLRWKPLRFKKKKQPKKKGINKKCIVLWTHMQSTSWIHLQALCEANRNHRVQLLT